MKAFGLHGLNITILILLWKCGSDNCLIAAYKYAFTTQPTSTEVLNGLAGELKCIFANNVDATECFWMKDNVPMKIEGRYQYKGTPKTGDCSISISGSNLMQDDGEWVCGMPGSSMEYLEYTKSDPPAKYTVLYAPKDPIIKQNGVQVQNGSEINVPNVAYPPKIECKSESGNPGADLEFYLENRNILRGNYTLFNETMMNNKTQTAILQLTESMDVTWVDQKLTCQATHAAYNATSVFVNIYIRSPHPPESVLLTADGKTGEITANSHQYILLFCKADGYPIPVLSWYNRISEDDEWVSYQQYNTGNGTANNSIEAVNSQFLCRATCDGTNYYQSNTITIKVNGDTSTAQLGLIISIAVGGVVLAILVAVGICLCCRYRKKQKKTRKPSASKTMNTQNNSNDTNLNERQQSTGENDPNGSKRYKSNYPAYAYVQSNRNRNIHELETNSDGMTSDA